MTQSELTRLDQLLDKIETGKTLQPWERAEYDRLCNAWDEQERRLDNQAQLCAFLLHEDDRLCN